MCPNDTATPCQPLLTSRLFDSEAGSDVTFLVGHEPDTWRFPGHRWVLAEANPVFRAMLAKRDDESPEMVIPITDLDGKAFDLLLRYLYKEEVVIQSVPTALSTFYAAQKYLCPGLMKLCITYLDQTLDVSNALQVFEFIRMCSGQCGTASAPDPDLYDVEPDPNSNVDNMLNLSRSLLHNCLLFIDSHAPEILVQESIEDLKQDSLKEIVQRDTLYAPESLVYAAIERWCNVECKRYHKELSPDNLRGVLGDEILFSVRYLLMDEREFLEGPMTGNLLTKPECTVLFAILRRIPIANTTCTITEECLAKWKQNRKPPKYSRIPLTKRGSDEKRKTKDKKKKKEKEVSPGRCTSACVTDYVVRALQCLFD
uniref:BTB/POZ domain-containing protein 2 n=1 Tax=Lygus hesperus TaxID=30085 RepID=A0A0A9WD89_LYGHE